MQKIMLFIEPNNNEWLIHAKIGDMFMNRFAIDEDASCEIMKRFELDKTSSEISWSLHTNYEKFAAERSQKGMDHFITCTSNMYE